MRIDCRTIQRSLRPQRELELKHGTGAQTFFPAYSVRCGSWLVVCPTACASAAAHPAAEDGIRMPEQRSEYNGRERSEPRAEQPRPRSRAKAVGSKRLLCPAANAGQPAIEVMTRQVARINKPRPDSLMAVHQSSWKDAGPNSALPCVDDGSHAAGWNEARPNSDHQLSSLAALPTYQVTVRKCSGWKYRKTQQKATGARAHPSQRFSKPQPSSLSQQRPSSCHEARPISMYLLRWPGSKT
jgi:hypothetical protein